MSNEKNVDDPHVCIFYSALQWMQWWPLFPFGKTEENIASISL
jgi:hypothetical protein